VLAGGVLQTPSMPIDARRGHGCHELRVQAEHTTRRTLYFIDVDAIVVIEVFAKKTNETPRAVIDVCKRRLRSYHAARKEEST
jgi:phage-related protein